ncbi:MAG TPA: hypothetical protein VI455_10380 [Terriglobia bacterium]
MKPMPSRKPSSLSEICHQRLSMYAIAAGATGVGMLALAPPSAAEVVYTPAHADVVRHGHLFLDLNHDGKADFEIAQRSGCTTGGAPVRRRQDAGRPPTQFGGFCTSALYVYVPYYGKRTRGNAAIGNGSGFPPHRAYALKSGAPISSAQPFGGFYLNFRSRGSNTEGTCLASWGSWINVTNRYLGLKFHINGEIHFGWARLNATCSPTSRVVALRTGYAYETIANKPIVAGQTRDAAESPGGDPNPANFDNSPAFLTRPDPAQLASLGALALGAQGLSIWRRKESVSAAN